MHNSRGHSSKYHSAKTFRRNVGQTHPKNMGMAPRRGGWRL